MTARPGAVLDADGFSPLPECDPSRQAERPSESHTEPDPYQELVTYGKSVLGYLRLLETEEDQL